MNTIAPRHQNRDDRDGRYTFDGDMSRLCVCGHSLGIHAGAAPHECFVNTFSLSSKERRAEANHEAQCTCPKFRPSRKKH